MRIVTDTPNGARMVSETNPLVVRVANTVSLDPRTGDFVVGRELSASLFRSVAGLATEQNGLLLNASGNAVWGSGLSSAWNDLDRIPATRALQVLPGGDIAFIDATNGSLVFRMVRTVLETLAGSNPNARKLHQRTLPIKLPYRQYDPQTIAVYIQSESTNNVFVAPVLIGLENEWRTLTVSNNQPALFSQVRLPQSTTAPLPGLLQSAFAAGAIYEFPFPSGVPDNPLAAEWVICLGLANRDTNPRANMVSGVTVRGYLKP